MSLNLLTMVMALISTKNKSILTLINLHVFAFYDIAPNRNKLNAERVGGLVVPSSRKEWRRSSRAVGVVTVFHVIAKKTGKL